MSSSSRELDAEIIERAGEVLGGVPSLQTAADAPESQMRCMGAILGRIVANKNGDGYRRLAVAARNEGAAGVGDGGGDSGPRGATGHGRGDCSGKQTIH